MNSTIAFNALYTYFDNISCASIFVIQMINNSFTASSSAVCKFSFPTISIGRNLVFGSGIKDHDHIVEGW